MYAGRVRKVGTIGTWNGLRGYDLAKREKLGHRLHHQDLKFEPE